ncbi:hypothetical protein ACSBR2_033044 [Camellia fascicularis]
MFRFLASIFHTVVASNTTGIVWEDELKPSWLRWGFWLFPMTYGEIGLALNEFLAPRWQKLLVLVLLFQMKSFPKFKDLKIPPVLPMQKQNLQILLTILQNLIKGHKGGSLRKKLQLLCDITCAFRPGVLATLMGVSGARKTTLMVVLAGRKTSGTIEGDIRIGGFPKVEKTFARILGYCKQTDIHSPQITVEESVEFVKEVLEIIELDKIKDCLVGMPGVTEQRKWLTISVELIANPSIVFMDEPTTRLDARAVAIVMRAVKNVAETGRILVLSMTWISSIVFHSKLVLASPEIATDANYAAILGVIGHEVRNFLERCKIWSKNSRT